MFLDEFRTFQKVCLAISLYKVITDTVYVVNNHKLDIFLLHSLGQVKENFVVVLNILTEVHDDILTDSSFGNSWLMFDQEVIFHLIESFLVKMLTSNNKQCLSAKASLLLR